MNGLGSLVITVTDSCPVDHELVPLKIRHAEIRCTLNLSKLKRLSVGIVCKLGERKPAQGENANQPAEIGNDVYGLDTVTANYMPISSNPFRKKTDTKILNAPFLRSLAFKSCGRIGYKTTTKTSDSNMATVIAEIEARLVNEYDFQFYRRGFMSRLSLLQNKSASCAFRQMQCFD
ncbi:hypothetical protein TNCV_4873471 [Trichonephila clavipes]|nr:hypothetical protein TNCV_4873471 [Trichonephila clavipes]